MPLRLSIVFSIKTRSYRRPGRVGAGYFPSRLALSNAVGESPVSAAASYRVRPRGPITDLGTRAAANDDNETFFDTTDFQYETVAKIACKSMVVHENQVSINLVFFVSAFLVPALGIPLHG